MARDRETTIEKAANSARDGPVRASAYARCTVTQLFYCADEHALARLAQSSLVGVCALTSSARFAPPGIPKKQSFYGL
jgi:hypothetical protein